MSEGAVDDLVRLANELGLQSQDLDPVVYDATNQLAANRFNGGEWEDATWDDAYERLHDEADKEAQDINNGDLEAQIKYLIEGYGEDELRDILKRMAEEVSRGV